MYVCLCKAVSDKKIRKLVEKGAASVKEIQQESAAGTNCGTCLCYIQDILKQLKGDSQEAPPPCQKVRVSS